MSFTFPFKKSFLWHDIFTFPGSTLWFATVIFANSGDMLHLVKICFHIFYAFQLFCDNRVFWVSQIWRHHCILWQSSFDQFHRLGLLPVSCDNLRDDCHWRLGNILFATGYCHRSRVVHLICDKNKVKSLDMAFFRLVFVTNFVISSLLWQHFEELSQDTSWTLDLWQSSRWLSLGKVDRSFCDRMLS